ncbi:AI-2E family transporter [Candidatus Woesearchaeota archaeon]|nr:AI-2E family transporter [Candidatus Woesearchaeota archaeon]
MRQFFKSDNIVFYLLIIFTILSFMILQPFVIAAVSGIVFGIILKPIYKKLNKKIKNEIVSSFITTFLMVIIIILPFIIMLNSVIAEARPLVTNTQFILDSDSLFPEECLDQDSMTCKILESVFKLAEDENIKQFGVQIVEKAGGFVIQISSSFILSLPDRILHFFITLFVMFFYLLDGDKLFKSIFKCLPIDKKILSTLRNSVNDTVYGVIYGSLVIALIQGGLGALGFWIFGVSNSPILWGLVMTFAALIPFVGAAGIWGPFGIISLIINISIGDSFGIIMSIAFLLYSFFVVSTIDNVLKPKIIGGRAKIHPVFVLLGVLGGMKVMGFMGIIIGPIILGLFVTLANIFTKTNDMCET